VTYVKHLAKSIRNQVLAFMKSYFPKAPVEVVAGGLAANCTDEQYAELLKQMVPIAEQVAEKLNLQCHTRFYKENRMHLICAPGSIYTHMIDKTRVIPLQ
jgi:hypothetical protein